MASDDEIEKWRQMCMGRELGEVYNMLNFINKFIKVEAAAGIILMIATVLALMVSNSFLGPYYRIFLETPIAVMVGTVGLTKPLILWVNDGLMAIFFLLVGMEIKRELFEGNLNTGQKAILPLLAALGGMIAPALIYSMINQGDSVAMRGWAIPTATDIAFALGILALLSSRVPVGAKVFLTAIAILDDLGAIVIIALFYTADLSWLALGLAFSCGIGLLMLNRFGVKRFFAYGLLGLVMWVCVLKSGVHATLTGVAVAAAYPLKDPHNARRSPLRELETALHPWVAFGILPLFAFANAGVKLSGVTVNHLLNVIPLGIACGLFFGKQIGVFTASWLAVKSGLAEMPAGVNWRVVYGIAILCGIGFTMSLFIGTLAFGESSEDYNVLLRLGVLTGSLIAAIAGSAFIVSSLPKGQSRT